MLWKHISSNRLAISLLLLTVVAIAVVSCGDISIAEPDVTVEADPAIVDLVIFPSSATIEVDDSLEFQAYGLTAIGDSVDVTVSWTSSTGDPVKKKGKGRGLFKAKRPGKFDLSASADSAGVADTVEVTVYRIEVENVVIVPSAAALVVGDSLPLTVTVEGADGNELSDRDVVWSSSDENVVDVDANGLVTALAAGTARIEAESEGVSGTATLTVGEVPVAEVSISPSTADLEVGQQVTFTATLLCSHGNELSDRDVEWSSSDESVIDVDANGLVTALAAGTASIEAESEAIAGTATITVAQAPVATVEVSPSNDTINVAETLLLSAELRDVYDNVLSGRTIEWSSDNALVASVDGDGLVTGIGVNGGTVTITASSGGQSGTATVVVMPAPVATVEVSPSNDTVAVSQSLLLAATLRDADGNSLSGRDIVWTTSNPAIANVSANSPFTAIATWVDTGTVSFTATAEGQSGTATITADAGSAANRVFAYGFEDWGGDVASTPLYPFRNASRAGFAVHEAATEPVTEYNGLSPRSGNYFLLMRHDATAATMSPPVAGITQGDIYMQSVMGSPTNYPYGGQNPFDITNCSSCNETGEIFIRWYTATSSYGGWSAYQLKVMRLVDDYNRSGLLLLQNATGTLETRLSPPREPRFYDNVSVAEWTNWSWHRISIYLNANTGQFAAWFDVENETLENASMGPGNAGTSYFTPPIRSLSFYDNWSSASPPGLILHAIDDIEIWDGLPNGR